MGAYGAFMATTVLYCCDPLNPRRVDGHFAEEARRVRARGGGVGLIDHDALLAGNAQRAVAGVPVGLDPVWYRGWMIPSDRYCALADALDQRGVGMLISPGQYRSAHELPGWYRAFSGLTPSSAWSVLRAGQYSDGDRGGDGDDMLASSAALALLAGRLRPGAGIVKDYVKSRKHEWNEACFIPDLSDAVAMGQVVRRFVELQGEFLAGGVVLREFERFVTPRSAAGEVRVWWLDGEARLLTPHPDSPEGRLHQGAIASLGGVAAAVRRLGARFVTTDLALREDGVWRVVEVGDGQVSELHASVDANELVGLLLAG